MRLSLFLFILLIGTIVSSNAQLDTTFQFTYDLGGSEAVTAVALSDSGYMLIGGGSIYDTTFIGGFWFGKVAFTGELGWYQWHGDSARGRTPQLNHDLIRTYTGDYVYAGGFWDVVYGGPVPNDTFTWNPLVVRYDAAGHLVWNHRYPRPDSNGILRSGIQLADSGFLFVGHSYSEVDPSIHSVYLLRIDKEGVKIWDKVYSSIGRDQGIKLHAYKNGFALSGYGNHSTDPNDRDGLLIYTDLQGQVIRERVFGGLGRDGWLDIALADDSMSIYTVQRLDTTQLWAHDIRKLDSAGNTLWRTYIEDSLGRLAYGIISHPDGGVLVHGTLNNYNFTLEPDDYGWLARISDSGDILWQRAYQYPTTTTNIIYDILITEDRNILCVGTTVIPSGGGQNAWIMQLDSSGCLGSPCDTLPEPYREPVSIEAEITDQIQIYPNPASDHVVIEQVEFSPALHVSVYNMQGKLLMQHEIDSGEKRIFTGSLSEGLYLWVITDGTQVVKQEKILIQH